MVDLLGMFRRRPAKRNPPGFARSRADITALGDTIGELLTSPVRDAPPIARDAPPIARDAPPIGREAPLLKPEPPRAEKPRQPQAARPKTNGAGAAPRLTQRTGYLAVHSVEKSFGTRQVVRGVSIYVRPVDAAGGLRPDHGRNATQLY